MYSYEMLPTHMQHGAQLYLEHGVRPGGFMEAVLSNDLKEAFARADEINLRAMRDWVIWIYSEVPVEAHGSREKVENWINSFENGERRCL